MLIAKGQKPQFGSQDGATLGRRHNPKASCLKLQPSFGLGPVPSPVPLTQLLPQARVVRLLLVVTRALVHVIVSTVVLELPVNILQHTKTNRQQAAAQVTRARGWRFAPGWRCA